MGDRMALGITTILTIMFLLGSLNGNLPKVSYPKALDWYLLVSFSFVFMSLVECMIVFILNLRASEDKKRIKCKVCSKMPRTVFVNLQFFSGALQCFPREISVVYTLQSFCVLVMLQCKRVIQLDTKLL